MNSDQEQARAREVLATEFARKGLTQSANRVRDNDYRHNCWAVAAMRAMLAYAAETRPTPTAHVEAVREALQPFLAITPPCALGVVGDTTEAAQCNYCDDPAMPCYQVWHARRALSSTTDAGEAEEAAWNWLDSNFTNIEAGHDPNDRDYGVDDMVDAFIAGCLSAGASFNGREAAIPDGMVLVKSWRRIEHPRGIISPPDDFYAAEIAAFEKAHPFISHEKARNDDGSLMDWGRVRYHHSHVDAAFEGWVKGRFAMIPAEPRSHAPKPATSPVSSHRGEMERLSDDDLDYHLPEHIKTENEATSAPSPAHNQLVGPPLPSRPPTYYPAGDPYGDRIAHERNRARAALSNPIGGGE